MKNITLGAVCLLFVFIFATGCTREPASVHYKFTPESIDVPLKNPGMGWTTYEFFPFTGRVSGNQDVGPGDTIHQYELSSLAYSNYYTWRDLEPEEGIYRWDLIDELIDVYASKQMKVRIGFHLTDPTSIEGTYHIPDYVVKLLEESTTQTDAQTIMLGGEEITKPPVDGIYYNAAGSWAGTAEALKFEPYYWNESFLKSLEKFLNAFAVHYSKNEKWVRYLDSIDISTYGWWGEWHTTLPFPGQTNAGRQELRNRTLTHMIDQYFNAFNTMAGENNGRMRFFMNVIGGSVKQNLETQGVKHALEQGAGMVRRCVGEPSFLAFDETQLIGKYWKSAPVHGEWGIVGNGIEKFTYSRMNTEDAVEMALDLKMSTLGWYIGRDGHYPLRQKHSLTGETLEDYYQRRSGYQLVLVNAGITDALVRGESFTLDQSWLQKGNTTLYEKYSLVAYLVNENNDIALKADEKWDGRGWVQDGGEYTVQSEFTLPEEIPSGSYYLLIALVDEFGQPAVNLSIKGKENDDPTIYSRYTLGQVEIK